MGKGIQVMFITKALLTQKNVAMAQCTYFCLPLYLFSPILDTKDKAMNKKDKNPCHGELYILGIERQKRIHKQSAIENINQERIRRPH